MEAREFEDALNDLETRVDRLRALYENWFRGYEKIEPQVARKDVERRVYGLRKELPRNTALRFRYHQLYQRYTTLANYWQRTARQIEDGTHRLQVKRMKRRMGARDDAERVEGAEHERESREDTGGPKSYELDLDENFSVNDLLSDFEMEEVARAVDVPGPHTEPPPPKSDDGRAVGRFSRPKRGSVAPPRMLVSESSTRSQPPPAPEAQPRAPAPSVGALPPAPPVPRLPTAPGKLPAPALPPAAKPPAPGLPPVPGKPAAPAPAPGVAAGTGANRPPIPPPLAAAGAPKLPPAAPTRPGTPAPSVPSASGANPIPPERRAPAAGGGTKVGRPPPPPGMEGAGASGASAPNEQRMRRLYDEYAAARRKNNEGEVRYDALVTNIQKMLPELQKKHQGKQIDFEVVVKDGRVGLKPKAL